MNNDWRTLEPYDWRYSAAITGAQKGTLSTLMKKRMTGRLKTNVLFIIRPVLHNMII